MSCVYLSMVSPSPRSVLPRVSPTCPKIEITARVPPCPTGHLQEEGWLPGEFLPGEFLHASPTQMHHHHKNQLQPQDSPYLAQKKSGNAAAQRAVKLLWRPSHLEILRKQKSLLLLPVPCLSLPCSRFRITSHGKQR